jgi:hypothetical protein
MLYYFSTCLASIQAIADGKAGSLKPFVFVKTDHTKSSRCCENM